MNSHKFQKMDDFDFTIGRELKRWGAGVQAPTSARALILQQAAQQSRIPAEKTAPVRPPQILKRLQKLLLGGSGLHGTHMAYPDLTQWLFSQAAWHNLGIDRRATRLVC